MRFEARPMLDKRDEFSCLKGLFMQLIKQSAKA